VFRASAARAPAGFLACIQVYTKIIGISLYDSDDAQIYSIAV